MYNAYQQKRYPTISLASRNYHNRVSPLQDSDLSDLTKQEIIYWSNKLELSPSELFTLNDDELNERLNAAYYKISKQNQLEQTYNRFRKLENVRSQINRLKGGGVSAAAVSGRTAWQILHDAAAEIEKSYLNALCQSPIPQLRGIGLKISSHFGLNSTRCSQYNNGSLNAKKEEAQVLYKMPMRTATTKTAGRDTSMNRMETKMDSSGMHIASISNAYMNMGLVPVNRTANNNNNININDTMSSCYDTRNGSFARRSIGVPSLAGSDAENETSSVKSSGPAAVSRSLDVSSHSNRSAGSNRSYNVHFSPAVNRSFDSSNPHSVHLHI